MAGEPQLSIPVVDPFQSSCGISLAPRIIRASGDAPIPSDLNDLDSLHNFMNSLESSSPEKVMDEANAMFHKGTELLNTKYGEYLDVLGVDKDANTLKGKEMPPLRREGLGRKRARFSIKPDKTQASENLELSLNIDQLKDPAEFFSAVEKIENARREIQIQRGETTSQSNNYDPFTNKPHRRPGILGKSASYKHRFSFAIPEQDDMHVLSPEVAGRFVESQEGIDTPNNPEKEEIDVEGSIVETENKVNEILDELLSKDEKDLDGDGAESLLQELLQFKPVDIGNLSVPEFHEVAMTNFKTLTKNLPRTRKTLSNIGNLTKKLTVGTPKKHIQRAETPSDFVASPTPPRSPRTSISMLEKHALQSSTQMDHSSLDDVYLCGQRNPYFGVVVEEEPRQVSVLNESMMSGSTSLDMEVETCTLQDHRDIHGVRHAGSTDCAIDKNIDLQVLYADASPHTSQNDMLEQHTDMNSHCKADDIEGNKTTDNVGDELEVSFVEALPNNENTAKFASSSDMLQCNQSEEMHSKECYPDHQATEIQEPSSLIISDNSQNLMNEVTKVGAAEGSHMHMLSTIGETNVEKNAEKQHCKPKRSRGLLRESNAYSLSTSIAAGGTSFESGVRRSQRIKTRPLEYWKGERLVYGRVNDSLKLVGLKYISPSKGDGKLKVKSYVPDEYNKVLELAAAH